MGKNKGFDIISHAHERANHNINPYYWFNRVTPYTIAQWKIGKQFSPLWFLLYSLIGILMLSNLNESALGESRTLWAFIFDFGNSETSTRAVGLLLFFIFWIILGSGAFQIISQWIYTLLHYQPKVKPAKEKKKKHPKRSKNYGRS